MGGLSGREDIFAYLNDHQDDLKWRCLLERVAVIGSIARNDYIDESDVDIIVRFRPATDQIQCYATEWLNRLSVLNADVKWNSIFGLSWIMDWSIHSLSAR
jgi:predicted nucleotidyltransferase